MRVGILGYGDSAYSFSEAVNYADGCKIEKQGIKVKRLILFGSFATGRYHEDDEFYYSSLDNVWHRAKKMVLCAAQGAGRRPCPF